MPARIADAEMAPMLPGPGTPRRCRYSHATPAAALLVAIGLLIAQVLFQTRWLPALTYLPERITLSMALGVPVLADHLSDLAWIPITNHLDRTFHLGLVGARLDGKQRDALRKTDSLSTVLRLCTLKLPIFFLSFGQAFQSVPFPFAMGLCLGLVPANVLSRRSMGQQRAIAETWEHTVRRNSCFNVGGPWVEQSQERLNRSRLSRGICDKLRALLWATVVLVGVNLVLGDLSVPVCVKIFKDAFSLDDTMDKLYKSLVPALELIRTYRALGGHRRLQATANQPQQPPFVQDGRDDPDIKPSDSEDIDDDLLLTFDAEEDDPLPTADQPQITCLPPPPELQ